MSIYHTNRRDLKLGKRTHLAGILNLTPDSFSDGGDFVDLDTASLHFHSMAKAGAEIIDIGGESTRPGHMPISPSEEIARVVPFIKQIRPQTEALISIDTSKAEVAEAALAAGHSVVQVEQCSMPPPGSILIEAAPPPDTRHEKSAFVFPRQRLRNVPQNA